MVKFIYAAKSINFFFKDILFSMPGSAYSYVICVSGTYNVKKIVALSHYKQFKNTGKKYKVILIKYLYYFFMLSLSGFH